MVGAPLWWLSVRGWRDDSSGLDGLLAGLWAQRAAGGRVRVVGVVDRDAADHIGPLARGRTA